MVDVAWTVDIDSNDITSICQEIRWNPKLSRPASLIVRFPAHLYTSVTNGVSEMHLYYSGTLLFSGPVWFTQNTGSEDAAYTEVTAYDHLIWLGKRMCKTPANYAPAVYPEDPGPCDLADCNQVIQDYDTAPEILGAFIQATIDCAHDNEYGAFALTLGSVATGGASVTGAPADWPMDIATMANNLLDTGQLDIVVTPGLGQSTVDLYNGDYGTDLSGSVILQYATGSYTARTGDRTSDMAEVTNALWYLLGPKRPKYPGDIKHWAGSITPTAAHRNPPITGSPVYWPASLSNRWLTSRATYGYMQEIQTHDSRDDENSIRELFEEQYANEAYIRAFPREFSNMNPNRFTTIPSFYVGDLIGVQSGSALGVSLSGSERVYEYELTIDTDGVAEFTSLVTTASQD